MRDNQECPETTGSAARRAHGRLRNSMKICRLSGGLAVLVAAAAVALAAFSATSSAHRATPGKSSRSGSSGRSSRTSRSRARSTGTLPNDDSARPLNEWTTCERSHGDPNQADPTVAHEVIHIGVPTGATPAGEPQNVTATQFEYPNKACDQYLAAAQRAVAGGQPVEGWGDRSDYVEYANCMRANGYPTFPYPSGIEPDGHESTNFNGTGIEPNSPAFLSGNANQTCGKQIGAPAWWINNWGPPGSVELPMIPPPNAPKSFAPSANGEPGVNSGSGAAG
jgi:hypothetical protein